MVFSHASSLFLTLMKDGDLRGQCIKCTKVASFLLWEGDVSWSLMFGSLRPRSWTGNTCRLPGLPLLFALIQGLSSQAWLHPFASSFIKHQNCSGFWGSGCHFCPQRPPLVDGIYLPSSRSSQTAAQWTFLSGTSQKYREAGSGE